MNRCKLVIGYKNKVTVCQVMSPISDNVLRIKKKKGSKMETKVLFVDDEVDFVEVNKVALESKGYKVVVAYDGKEALEKALREKPDIIILDVMMRTTTEGFHISRQLRKHQETRDTPIIMLTAIRKKLDSECKIEPDEEWLPVTEFLDKPVRPDKLIEKMEEVLNKRKKMSP